MIGSKERGGFAVLLSFLCGIPVSKSHIVVLSVVVSNPTVCSICAFKPMLFGKTKLFALFQHQLYRHSLHAAHVVWAWFCDGFVVRKIVKVMTLIVSCKILYYMPTLSLFSKAM